MKPITTTYPARIGTALAALALTIPTAQADLVAQWRGADYPDGAGPHNWTSTAATGSIVATLNGDAPEKLTAGYVTGTAALDLVGNSWFTVAANANPVAGATKLSLVAIFRPLSSGSGSGANFVESSGLLGMEQAGVTADWGLGWTVHNRVAAGASVANTIERSLFSPPKELNEIQVAMFTWDGATGIQRLFMNGVEVSRLQTDVVVPRNGGDFALGAITSGGLRPFNGEIAELRIYDSDESASAGAISDELRNGYVAGVILDTATLTLGGGRFVLIDSASTQIDNEGVFELSLDDEPIPAEDIVVTKTGGRTTVAFVAGLGTNQVYSYELTVPGIGAPYLGSLTSAQLPADLPGQAGSVGSWGIREIPTGGAGQPANVGNNAANPAVSISAALSRILSNPETFYEGTAPVFNHSDVNGPGVDGDYRNGPLDSGSFNNDFSVLSRVANPATPQNWVVIGKTQVEITTPGEYTFAIHSDDGFAMRVSGAGGGRFVSTSGNSVNSTARIDYGDDARTILCGDVTISQAVYVFDAAGTYDILYLGFDGGGGGRHEVAWAPGSHLNVHDTNQWRLVGDDSDLPPFRDRYIANPPGPTGTDGNFGIRTYLTASIPGTPDPIAVGNLANTDTFLRTTDRAPGIGTGVTVDAQEPFLNHRDPNDGSLSHLFFNRRPFPGNTTAGDQNVVTVAKGRISVPVAGTHTFVVHADDGFIFRLKGANGNPDPVFTRVTAGNINARFEMSNPNEMFFDGANVQTRGIIDLQAGAYDIEFIHVENTGGFHYELGSAVGAWPNGTTPPNGFQLVGGTEVAFPGEVVFPSIDASGWTVEASLPGIIYNPSNGYIADAEKRIADTAALAVDAPIWAQYYGAGAAEAPGRRITTDWAHISFHDPGHGGANSFLALTSPWPLDRPADPPFFDGNDNDYAMRATGTLVITRPGTYHLGFQGDDGGYMYFYGKNGNPDPTIGSIVSSNHILQANINEQATIGDAPDSDPGTNNAITVALGTGNSRTLVSLELQEGEYEIRTLVSEGGGGSWWEVIGGSAAPGYNYPLLTKGGANGGNPATIDTTAFALITQSVVEPPGDDDFKITNPTFTMGEGGAVDSVSFDFGSQVGETYVVEASATLMDDWEILLTVEGTGEIIHVVLDTELEELELGDKYFFRVRSLE